nr:ABC transporter ATP-binding protein [uncultured Acetatifactor sp.]
MNTPILEVSDIQKYYGNKGNITKAVNRISLSAHKGEFVGIMGASGSGKTTLLNCISTIDTVTSGKILVEGKDITTLRGKQLSAFRREKLGFIFQDFNLLDTLTAYENISLALSISGIKAKEIDKRVQEIARALNITEVLEKYPYQMSGGQQQRVAAARAMVTNPALVLADEPTGALDSKASDKLLRIFARVNEDGQTILMVTHSIQAASCAGRVLFIKDGCVFNQIYRGRLSDEEMYRKISDTLTILHTEKTDTAED